MGSGNASSDTAPGSFFVTLYLVILLSVAAYVRVSGAGIWHVSPDDINHIEMAHGQTLNNVLRYSLYETHPPLGQFLRHYWMMISEAPWFLRSFALLFGLMLIPLYYRIGEKLAGPWAGLACATLMAFSYGCIIQSYVVRNYTLYLLLLSLALYSQMLWHERRTYRLFALYFISGTLATLTHFSGLFGIFTIAMVEAFLLLKARSYRTLLAWGAVNLLIAAIALCVIHRWEPILALTRTEVHAITGNPHNWFYPVLAMDYLFAFHTSVPYLFFLFAFVVSAVAIAALRLHAVRTHALMAVVSLTLGSALVISGLYIAGLNRNSLWLLPFILPSVGAAIGLFCIHLATKLPKVLVAALLLLILGSTYSSAVRYKDGNEYMMTEKDWQDFTQYLGKLDATHLLVLFRGDTFLIAYPGPVNPYDFYALKDSTPPNELTALMPYHQTAIVFKPYRFNYAPEDLLTLVQEALNNGKLKNIDTLVFTSTLWSSNTTKGLILCDALTKTITAFPPAQHKLTAKEVDIVPAIVLQIPKKAFLDELISPTGKAHGCLAATH